MKTKIFFLLLAVALASCTKRQPEEIDYAPNSPFNPYPADSATNIDHTTLDVTLRWTATDPNSGDALSYTLFVDTLNPPESKIASDLAASSYFLTGLSYNTTYYWKLYVTDDKGVTATGPVWQFTTLPHANSAPSVPVYLEPANDSAGTYPTLMLAWSGSDPNGVSDTVSYSLYMGTSSVPPLVNSTPEFSYEACCLNYSTLYRWQVVATDNHGAVSAGILAQFTTRDSPWFLRAPIPLYRKGFATAMAYNKIYAIGGLDENNTVTGTVQEYDPLLDIWNIKTPMPTPRYDLAAAAANNLIYAVGGKNSTEAIVGTTEEYNPATDTWTGKSSMVTPRFGLTSQSYGGLVYAVGGLYSSTINSVLVVEEYNPATNLWVRISFRNRPPIFLPGAKLYSMSCVLNKRIYFAGGTDPRNNITSSEVASYDPITKKLYFGTNLPAPRTNGFGIAANGYFYIVGGYDLNYLRRVDKYNPGTGVWAARGDMLNSRSGCGGGILNNRIYVVGGFNPDPVFATEEYRIDLDP